jgi:hypothetical protein
MIEDLPMNDKNKNSMRHTFDEVMKLDQSLQYLASYELSHGKMIIPKSMDEMMELNAKIAEKFNYFKALIHSGECTFDFIKNSVLSKNGPYPRAKFNIDSINTQSFDKEEELAPTEIPYDPTKSLVEKLVSSLFPGSTIEKIEQKKIEEIPIRPPTIKATKSIEEKPKKKSKKK